MEKKALKPNFQDKSVYIAQGIEWLLKAGAIEHPDVQETLVLNVLMIDDRIEDVALVFDSEKLKLLVYIEMTKEFSLYERLKMKIKKLFGERLKTEDEIGSIVLNKLHQVLPRFDIRVTFDLEIYTKSIEISKKVQELRKDTFHQLREEV